MPNRPIHSCIRCANRKVKCDRQKPCGACVKHDVVCVFNASEPPRKRHRRAKEQILTDQLRHYEALLQGQGIDPGKFPITPNTESRHDSSQTTELTPRESHLRTPVSVESESSHPVNKAQVVHSQGRSTVVEKKVSPCSLWTRVVEEFHDAEDALEDSWNDESDSEGFDEMGFVLDEQSKSKSKSRHPSPEHIHQLLQTFTENVDPLTKILHLPTLRQAIRKAVNDLENIPRSFESLMFAIYSVSVMTLNDHDCRDKFGEPRKVLCARYISATKVALSRARFMGTISLVVLQALVLHIVAVRDILEPRIVWSLTGIAVRIAQSMGLERDGESVGLPPFEAEYRRRIWWLLKTHDFRTAELCGLSKFRDVDLGDDSTKWPTNVNDDQLYPGMSSIVVAPNAMTDCIFVSLRYELLAFAAARVTQFRGRGKPPGQWDLHVAEATSLEIDGLSQGLEELLETKYLRYCDPSQPLHLVTMLMGRFAMNVVRFLTHHPRRWASIEQTPFAERQWVWEISIKLLEQHHMLQCSPTLKQFSWHAAYFRQWHAYIHVLDTLRADPNVVHADKVWHLISGTYEHSPEMVSDTKKPIHVAVGNLCLKAYSARETVQEKENMCLPPAPEFILQLRRQREAARDRRRARDAKSVRTPDGTGTTQGQMKTHDVVTKPNAGLSFLSDTLGSTHLQQATLPQQSSFPPNNGATGDEMFWFVSESDDNQMSNMNDLMGMDTDVHLFQEQTMEDSVTRTINWEQWDAWLADSNMMHPMTST